MKDILIGAADLYSWKDIKAWAISARRSGFDGDIYLITYRVDDDVFREGEAYGIEFYPVTHTPYSTPIVHTIQNSPTQSHNLRFYHAWELLTRLYQEGIQYRYVIMTDVRDVIFQTNPTDWLLNELSTLPTNNEIVASSEAIRYCDEEWGKENLINGFGQLLYDLEGYNWQCMNVGTIAGYSGTMKDLFHTIFRMTEGRYYPSDQSSFNVLLRSVFIPWMYASQTYAWAAQCGTTLDPTKSWLWGRCNEPRPTILENGIVVNSHNTPFVIVHQYDRVPELKKIIQERYS